MYLSIFVAALIVFVLVMTMNKNVVEENYRVISSKARREAARKAAREAKRLQKLQKLLQKRRLQKLLQKRRLQKLLQKRRQQLLRKEAREKLSTLKSELDSGFQDSNWVNSLKKLKELEKNASTNLNTFKKIYHSDYDDSSKKKKFEDAYNKIKVILPVNNQQDVYDTLMLQKDKYKTHFKNQIESILKGISRNNINNQANQLNEEINDQANQLNEEINDYLDDVFDEILSYISDINDLTNQSISYYERFKEEITENNSSSNY